METRWVSSKLITNPPSLTFSVYMQVYSYLEG